MLPFQNRLKFIEHNILLINALILLIKVILEDYIMIFLSNINIYYKLKDPLSVVFEE
jgi:hypothetical protein